MKLSILIILGVCLFTTIKAQNVTEEIIKNKILEIDKLKFEQKDKLEVYAKVANQEELVRVEKENWPEDIELTYNIFKDLENRIVFVSENISAANENWEISYSHYFNNQGQVLATIKKTRFFNDQCFDGELIELSKNYYSSDMDLLLTETKIMDTKGNILSGANCTNQYYLDFAVSKNVTDLLEIINYPI